MTAAEQLDRLLRLLPKLEARGPQPVAGLAAELGVSEQTLRKDIETLVRREHAEPAGFMEAVTLVMDGDLVSLDRVGYFNRPMALTRDEAVALDISIALLLTEYPESEHERLTEARQKLARIRVDAREPQGIALAVRIGQVDLEARRFRNVLETCVAEKRLASIHYQKPNDAAASARVVGPLGLVCVRGVWYLFATSGADASVRQFRLDRVRGAEALDERFIPPADFDLQALLRDGRPFASEARERVVIRYSGKAARVVAEDEGGVLDADGRIVQEYPLGDPDWAVRQVLRWGADAELLEPRELRGALVARLVGLTAEGGATGRGL